MKNVKVPETYNDVVGLYLTELRKAKGVTQAAVGRGVGCSQPVIARLENGKTPLTVIGARKFARYFKMSTPYFVQTIEDRAAAAKIRAGVKWQ